MSFGLGFALSVIGGCLEGLWIVPQIYINDWGHEHSWFVFIISLIVIVCSYLNSFVENIKYVPEIFYILLCGLAWGFGIILFGFCDKVFGKGITYTVISTGTISFGTLIPIIIYNINKLKETSGIMIIISIVTAIIGLIFIKKADTEKTQFELLVHPERHYYDYLKIIMATLCSMCFGLIYPIGNSVGLENNVIITLAYFGAIVPNLIFALVSIFKNNSFNVFKNHPIYNSIMSIGMALLMFYGNYIYGLSTEYMDINLSLVIFIVCMVLSSNISSIVLGEYKYVTKKGKMFMLVGIIMFLITLLISFLSHEL